MKIFITGGTGFVGRAMTRRFTELGHDVTVLTRSGGPDSGEEHRRVTRLVGNATVPGPWQERVADHQCVINLAGASIFTLWTENARRDIVESRVLTTRNVVDALSGAKPETVLLSASAVGYYGGRNDDLILDESSPPGHDFLARLGVTWEEEAIRAERFGVRTALCRFGIVLGRGGGALPKMLPAFKRYLGGPLGSGKQWFPWIHIEDLCRIPLFLMDRTDLSGPFNCVAPNPVRNADLTKELGRALGKPTFMPAVPAFVLRTLLGEFGNVLLEGQRALPRRLLEAGFQFLQPTLAAALRDLVEDAS